MIFNIQRFSLHDGEGIRTIIFFKGCPLSCQWCSNPESQSFGYSVMYDNRNCRNFGDCILAGGNAVTRTSNNGIEVHRDLLNEPLRLKDICPSRAITISGEEKSVDELIREIEKDAPFYRDNGGVTLSGGEPLAQGNELTILLQQLKSRMIKVCIETSLHVKWTQVTRCMDLVDTFLVDLKHTDKDIFRNYTQGDAGLVMENLAKLADSGASVVVRIPVVPGFNHTEHEQKEMIDFVSSLHHVPEIHFLPYHTFGVEKYRMLDMDYQFGQKGQVQDTELEPYMKYAQSIGLRTKIGG
jgi:pyruvate formate lyase activating enzyme